MGDHIQSTKTRLRDRRRRYEASTKRSLNFPRRSGARIPHHQLSIAINYLQISSRLVGNGDYLLVIYAHINVSYATLPKKV